MDLCSWWQTGERNLFICHVTVSHRWIKRTSSLIRKNQCVLCRGSSLWAHREAYLTKTTKTAKYIFVCTSFLSLCHITLRKNCQKVKSQLLLHPSSCNDDAYIFLRLSSSHSQVTFWHCWRKMKKIFSNRKYTSSKCDCLNRWLALALSSADV